MVSYHNASVQLEQQDARTEQAIKDRAQKLRQEEADADGSDVEDPDTCLLYTSPSPRDRTRSRMPSSA